MRFSIKNLRSLLKSCKFSVSKICVWIKKFQIFNWKNATFNWKNLNSQLKIKISIEKNLNSQLEIKIGI